ncbi:NADH-quinone oxidoreductase subunit N [Candidatus Methanoprimaticola sp. MG2]|uniref:NADH-quinone oxidoreductase subunit N n=1 Tax=Candidatus Methanoprimaticola sp. MG2 TaxID=3228838 RepID=UPI0039C74A7E
MFVADIFGDYAAVAPMILLLIAALIIPAVHILGKKRTATWAVALVFVVASLLINLYMLTEEFTGSTLGMYDYNAYTGLMVLLFQIVLFLAVLVSNASTETTRLHVGAFYSLIIGATTGMMFVAGSSDLLTIFVGVELTSISSYALVTMKRNDSRAAEAGVKYVIVGGLSTALTIYGISMIYGLFGTTDIATIAASTAVTDMTWMLAVGLVCMVAGYGFKIAAVPFHMWAPDVYEGAPSPVSLFLATGSKKMGLGVFFQIFLVLFVAGSSLSAICGEEVQYLFAIIAAFTMTIGNVVAIAQNNIKRMLAYSSIAQAGYILIVMAVMTEYGVASGMFHMFTHVFMKGGAFLIVGALICAGIGEKISDYKGLAKRAPFLAAAMLLFLFSLAGIPPLAGFTSKFFLFNSAIGGVDGVTSQWVWLAFIAILNSAISLYYYARVVKAMYIEKGSSTEKIVIPKTFLAAIVICVVFVIVLGVYPTLLFDLCETAASVLLG